MRTILIIFLLLSTACQEGTQTISVSRQEERVDRASVGLAAETLRLQSLRDSLEIKVQQNIDLGMTTEKARSVEQALIQLQVTVVKASDENLRQQREMLALMKIGPR